MDNHQKAPEGSYPKSRITFIGLLDKPNPPDHSFVTGMLAQALPSSGSMRVELLVASRNKTPEKPLAYHRAAILPVLARIPRAVLARIFGSLRAFAVTLQLIKKARRRSEYVVLFVRNDPALLMIAGLLRPLADRLVFQSSFPLEDSHDSRWKRWIHRSAYRLAARNVDAVLAVSPLGLLRTRKLVPVKALGMHIPLLADLPNFYAANAHRTDHATRTARFVYIGTHRARRHLDVVLRAVVRALEARIDAEFLFIGGQIDEIGELRSIPRVELWERRDRIIFRPPVPRGELPKCLSGCDVGLCLIPITKQYKEASPTKLAEYMGAGIAVLASSGIDLQETFIRDSEGGILVPFREDSIAAGIQRLASDKQFLERCKRNAFAHAQNHLQYSSYVSDFRRLIGSDE
jgi:glycosyltransferase involved in cell wall biosynthesis